MENGSVYGECEEALDDCMESLLSDIEDIRMDMRMRTGMDPVEHLLGRIKSDESMREKCRRKGIPENEDSALNIIHDAIGIRIVCAFIDDIYVIRDRILKLQGMELIDEKDYIRHVKPNGYRSLHMIVKRDGFYAEIQLRTISMDTWAALEHHMKYKKDIKGNMELITSELKRCADELAGTDASMQAIRDMIEGRNLM